MQKFGDILAELRGDRGLTQKQLAKILHVTGGTISNYEKGVHYPDMERIIELSDFFDVTADYLLGRTSNSVSPNVLGELLENGKSVSKVIEEIRTLPSELRSALLTILDQMSNHVP